ncbi:hypothetical protein DRQ25_18380 [Candidatus Fermentibacteria bacterium]|nr:MAG: hypothetical protein DRQ25_18380 [Candidatus Fermentibacteria bacterium]
MNFKYLEIKNRDRREAAPALTSMFVLMLNVLAADLSHWLISCAHNLKMLDIPLSEPLPQVQIH